MAEDIIQALQAAGLKDYFDALAPSHRKEYVQWVEEAKKPETRTKRIQKICEMLDGRKNGRR